MNTSKLSRDLKEWLPESYIAEIMKIKRPINEIRLRAGGLTSVTSGSSNIKLSISCDANELCLILSKLCGNSVHAYGDSLKNGYISLKNGYRAGVSGRAVINGGELINITDISSINIRVPNFIENVSEDLIKYITNGGGIKSVLIYSAPGGGKTTLLRDVAVKLAGEPHYKRLALIDSRMELYDSEKMRSSLIDVYSGYPKATAIELATRTMGPECIMCDEIGGYEEATALLSSQNAGVPLIASAHASDFKGLLKRKNIMILHENNIFDCYVGITRRSGSERFDYVFNEWSDAECYLK